MAGQFHWRLLKPDKTLVARYAAIAEPAFVLIAGTLLAELVLSRLHMSGTGHYLYGSPAPDFRSAAYVLLIGLVVRYGIVLGLAALLGWWRGRTAPASYALVLGARGLSNLIGVGILLGLLASLPTQILRLISAYATLGPGTRFWALQARVPWNADFWLYMAVGSFIVVPLFEELYARGYLLGRVRESFSAGGALLMMAVFFAFAHGQYHHVDALAVADEASLLVWSLILGYAVYRTGSLIPALLAHILINIPMSLDMYWAVFAASLLALVMWRKAVASWIAGIVAVLREIDDWLPTLIGVVVFVAMMMTVGTMRWATYAWLGLFGMATVPGLFSRSAWARDR